MSAHARAQILYYAAENLDLRKDEFAQTIQLMTGENGKEEVDQALENIFYFASWADKFEGTIHNVPIRGVSLAMKEPLGVIAIVCPDNNPLLSFIHLVFSALCMGNTVVAVPLEKHPLCAIDMYQIFETSDFPPGAINIVTGNRDELSEPLSKHMQVDGIWYFGSKEGSKKN
jgi:aldehyde dehydrogenase (NAD+)